MALENLRSLQFSSSASTMISNHLDNNNFIKTPTCSCTTHHCSDMNAPRSQIINNNNKKFQFHLNIGGQTKAAPVSTVLIGMNGTRTIRPNDLHNTHTLCTCHSDMDDTIKKLDVRINYLGNVHSIESNTLGLAEDQIRTCNMCISDLRMTPYAIKNSSFVNKCLIGYDFRGLDLSGVNLGGSNFSNADFSGQKLTNADIRQPSVAVVWVNSVVNFTNVDFSGCFMWGGYAHDPNGNGFASNNYTGADFRYAIFPTAAQGMARFWGIVPTASFTNDSLAYANFSGQKLSFFTAAAWGERERPILDPANPDLYGIIMSNVSLLLLDVVGDHTLTPPPVADHANFQNIIITSKDVLDEEWRSNFTNYSIKSANFSGAHITRLSFVGSDLSGSNFTNATLHDCDFNGVNLTNVDFSGADLSGSDLFGADLTNVNWNNTTCPDGINTGTGDTCAALGFLCEPDLGTCKIDAAGTLTKAKCDGECEQNKY
jgi:uncharacterized protein YjbI with pentapeptide repeats